MNPLRRGEAGTSGRRPANPRAYLGLGAALVAAGALLAGTVPEPPVPEAGTGTRITVEQAWPDADRADLRDLTVEPVHFLDATTAVGTITAGDRVKLLIEKDGIARELRDLPADGDPRFEGMTAADNRLVWAESVNGKPVEIWSVGTDGAKPRMLTADTGNTLFYGNQHDLVIAGGRVHWVAGEGDATTQIRSVALTGGAVTVREEKGQWAMSAWPWITDDTGGQSGRIRMSNMDSGATIEVPFTGAEWGMCGPVWCRVSVMTGEGTARIDLMHADGTQRRRVAGTDTQAAVNDVAVLDRFEILSVPGPEADLTGTAALLVHDLATGRDVPLAVAADLAATKDGVLWWSTGSQEAAVWHTLDLRTI
ncbi:hypothetical protein [Actinoplanes couchii]|uniref:Uncharacterized protein n=1 Tax=Actinoplanes couchii TaxID=403638 RepID=A0ABQ3X7I2_9ACTN|nr:hypothetical protein [Actinoplanes couchii]MDR6322303.1 hypothetical protein [Actinoplanes couchii]GID54462.1 hypothetical protein Aco03nite_028660 [Actinoplanes couchii]